MHVRHADQMLIIFFFVGFCDRHSFVAVVTRSIELVKWYQTGGMGTPGISEDVTMCVRFVRLVNLKGISAVQLDGI
jgi:hypothetical protein